MMIGVGPLKKKKQTSILIQGVIKGFGSIFEIQDSGHIMLFIWARILSLTMKACFFMTNTETV